MTKLNEFLLAEIEKFGGRPASHTLNDKTFDVTGYTTAIQRATRDLTARTLTPIAPDSGKLIDALLDAKDPDSFLNQIKTFFEEKPKTKDAFDAWHHERCNEVLKKIQYYYKNKNNTDVCYGKAQKIVNMTMKGCYCLKGAREREAYFEYCHMALDSFTLAWYNRNASIKTETRWSNLEETEYKNIQYGYDNCSIRTITMDLEPFKDLTPLQKEFLIWPLEIMINTVKEVNKCFGGLVDAPYVKEYFTRYGMGFDLTMANDILDRPSQGETPEGYIEWLQKIPKNRTGKHAAAQFLLEKHGI